MTNSRTVPFESATGIKNVTFNEITFKVILNQDQLCWCIDNRSMAQSAGTLVMYSLQKTHKNTSVYLLTVDKARFRKPVCPGDILVNQVKKKRNLKNILIFSCFSYLDDKLVAESEISAILNNE